MRVSEAGYRLGAPVLRGVEARAGPGEVLLVVGASGSGKTTLFLASTGVLVNLLGGYVKGRSSMCGVNTLRPDGFRRVPALLGIVLQDPDKQLSLLTPLDEVMFVLENLGVSQEEAVKRARRILARFGLAGRELADSALLSGGEKRRLTLAAALVHDPPVLMLDEPTASMDPWGVREVRRVIAEEKRRGRTVVIIEHKARYFLDMADRVVALRGGRVAGSWRPGEVSPERLARLGADASPPRVLPVPEGGGETLLRASGVSVGYDRPLIRGVDLSLRRGDILAIAGPNGAGKTTLLKVLAGLVRPLEGEVDRRERVFYVPQLPDYMFMFRTVRRELEYSAERGLGRAALEDALRSAPWLRGVLDYSPYKLSHGQRRWLTLLIARLHGARVLLLDEPSTGLDLGLYKGLCRIIRGWAREGAVAMATHDPRLVAECSNRAAIVEDGRLREAPRERVVREMEEVWMR